MKVVKTDKTCKVFSNGASILINHRLRTVKFHKYGGKINMKEGISDFPKMVCGE